MGPSGPEMRGSGIHKEFAVGRGVGKALGTFGEVSSDGILVDVVAVGLEVASILDAAKGEALFPDGQFGFQAEGEAPFDVLHGFLDGDVGSWRDEEVEVVGHEDEGVQLVAAFGAVVVEEVQE